MTDEKSIRFYRMCDILCVTPESLARFMHIEVPEVPERAHISGYKTGGLMAEEEQREVERWQYACYEISATRDLATYNLLGANGWELIQFVMPEAHRGKSYAIFKRRIKHLAGEPKAAD